MYKDGVARILYTTPNIAEESQMLLPLLDGQAPPFEETLDWLQCAYIANRTRVYVAPASMVFVQSAVSKEDDLFTAIWRLSVQIPRSLSSDNHQSGLHRDKLLILLLHWSGF